jgi:peptidoglycan hydrolase-like protein with peptidoglycan-binding domain
MSIRKIVSAVIATTTFLMMANPVFGVTAEELLAQIQQLQAQLNQLMAQYQQLTGQPAAGVPAACTGITFDRDLKLGMSGNDVKCLQALLNQDPDTKVADTGAGSPGNETTYFGPKTKAAVIKFQEKYAADILTPVGLTAGTGYVGAKTRAKLNSLLVVVPPPPPVVFEPMTVKVAADTPPAANIQRGTPNNPVLKIVLSGSETEAVNVSGITLTQYGNASDTAISYVRLWDENGVQLGSDRTVIGGKAMFVLVPTLQISAKGTRTITATVDVTSSADVLTTVQLGVNAATDVLGAAFTGNFPLKGNVFTIVPAGQYGSLSVGGYGTLPKYNVKIGEKDVVLNRFIVSAGAREDVRLTQVTIEGTSDHSAVDTDITNIRIREVGGSVVGGPVNLSAKKATINLVSGVVITKGTSKKFEVVADVVSGNGRHIDLKVPHNKVIGVGVSSGISIVGSGTDADFAYVVIGVGSLTVTQSANHPVGTAANYVKTTISKPMAVISVKAVGEDILINQVVLAFAGLSSSDPLTSVGLYDGDSLVSDLKDSVASTANQTFSLNWIVPANTTKDLTVKAVTHNITSASVSIYVNSGSISGYGLSSGESISGTVPALSAITVYSSGQSSLTLDDVRTPLNQGVLSPLTNVLLGAIKVRVTREDMKLYSLDLTAYTSSSAATTSGAVTSTAVSDIVLYDTDGNPLTGVISATSATPTFTIQPSDLLQDVVFPKDTYKTVLVKGRVSGTSSNNYYFLYIPASGLVLLGTESDATTSAGDLVLGNSSQGNYLLSTLVVEIKKDPESPSGSVSRGSYETYAIWDVTNPTGNSASISTTTFTSKTGLPSAVGTTTSYFRLYDELGNYWTATSVASSTGKVTFNTSGLSIPAGGTKRLYLRIDTTNTSIWPSNTTMQWTVAAMGDVSVSGGYVGYAGTVWSIPADTNVVKLP